MGGLELLECSSARVLECPGGCIYVLFYSGCLVSRFVFGLLPRWLLSREPERKAAEAEPSMTRMQLRVGVHPIVPGSSRPQSSEGWARIAICPRRLAQTSLSTSLYL